MATKTIRSSIAQYFDDLKAGGYSFYNTRKQGGEWCDMTVDWAMCKAFGPENARAVLYQPMESCGAGCCFSAQYYRDHGAWISRGGEPRTGDQIFFGPKGDETHTGLVERVDASNVYTIEGNTSDRLLRKSYGRNESKIAGYGRPNYQVVAYLFIDGDTPIHDDEEEIDMDEVKKLIAARKPTRAEIMEATGDQWVETFADLPNWAKPEIRELIELGALKGTKPAETVEDVTIAGSVNNLIRPMIIAFRAVKAAAGDAPKEVLADMLKRVLAGIYAED